MKIDWFTLIAQVINFLVLMWLLKRYLYKPILNAISERENKIVAQLNDAEAKKKEARKEREEFNRKNEEFDRQKDEMMEKAREESKAEEQKLKEEARKKANALKDKLEKEIREEEASRNQEIARKIQQEVLEISRKTLKDLSSVSLEEQAVHTFTGKINQLQGGQRDSFIATVTGSGSPVLVQSAFELPEAQRNEIQQVVNAIAGREITMEYKSVPDLISGIELSANGYKLAWSISDYIDAMEKRMESETSETMPAAPEETGHETSKK